MKNTGENTDQKMGIIRFCRKGMSFIAGHFFAEMKTVFQDAGAVLLFLIALFIYPLLYTLGYQNETIRDLPIAVVDLDHSASSRRLSFMADATEQIRVFDKPGSLAEARDLFYNGDVKGILMIPENFEKDIMNGKQAVVTAYCDASYFLVYKQVYSGIAFSGGAFGGGVEVKRMLAEGKSYQQALEMQDPLQATVYTLYNPGGGYGSFVIPGIVMVILQQTLLIGLGMMGGTRRDPVARSHASPWFRKRGEIAGMILGQSSVYVSIYIINVLFGAFILPYWFNFPQQGSVANVFVVVFPFLFAVTFLGLAIGTMFRERVQSLLFLVFLSPIVVFVSGISWPVSALPEVLRWLTWLLPTTFLVPAYLKIQLLGASLHDVVFELRGLVVQGICYFALAFLLYRRQWDSTASRLQRI
jgi:ABC-2 type transport system permease protein